MTQTGAASNWEGDLIVGAGQRSEIATLVERKTRHTILLSVGGNHSAQVVGDALTAAYTQLPPALRRTLTWDQGNEMFHHERIEASTGGRIYFADRTRPGSAEPSKTPMGCSGSTSAKGTDLSLVTDVRLREVADELNDPPRACLDDRSPTQLMRRWRRQLVTI